MKPKRFLLVDDDPVLLDTAREIFAALSAGKWDIRTAQNHAQALAEIQSQKPDIVVADIGMPVVDGVQFLRLLNRAHPGQQVVILTGLAAEEKRRECLDLGALLVLEKPTQAGGFQSIFAALDALVTAPAADGFRGMMRRVGLQDVLQMECLGAKSSILEIFTGRVRGRIYIHEGAIVHAESGTVQGEVALYSLLALRGGEFNLKPYAEPPRRTIEGQWEFLLMEAARLQDEAGLQPASEEPVAPEPEPVQAPPEFAWHPPDDTQIEEFLLCSGTGEPLHDWQCHSRDGRSRFLEQVEQQSVKINNLISLGRLERLKVHTPDETILCQIKPDRRLFVRSRGGAR